MKKKIMHAMKEMICDIDDISIEYKRGTVEY